MSCWEDQGRLEIGIAGRVGGQHAGIDVVRNVRSQCRSNVSWVVKTDLTGYQNRFERPRCLTCARRLGSRIIDFGELGRLGHRR
jgi:hypothetical protein